MLQCGVKKTATAHAVVCDGWQMQKGGWFTQINQIDRIICAYLRNLREIIFVTCCERSLPESAEIAGAGTSEQDANYLI